MSDDLHNAKNSGATPSPKSLRRRVRGFVFFLLILAVILPVFGQVVPELLFGIKKQEKPEQVSSAIDGGKNPSLLQESSSSKQLLTPSSPSDEDSFISNHDEKTPSSLASRGIESGDVRVKELEERMARLEAQLDELKNKQAASIASISQKSENNITAMVAYSQLKEALLRGEPYDYPLSQLEKVTVQNSAVADQIAVISADANMGITPFAELVAQFSVLAKQAASGEDSGWIKNTSSKFISIRKVGKQAGSDDEAIIARAETNLAEGDRSLAKATAELEKLSEPAKAIFAPWLANAGKYLAARASLDKLQILLATVSAPSAASENINKQAENP